MAETTGDAVVTQKMARHRDLKTTQEYMHARNDAEWAAAAGLQAGNNRGRG